MIKLLFLIIFLFAGPYSLRADEPPADVQEFQSELDNIKNPFEDGIPKEVTVNKPATTVYHREEPKVVVLQMPRSESVTQEDIKLPDLKLQGVIVGEDIHQAIINDQVVPLLGTIQGVQVYSVSKEGVGLSFRGKKFFLKVD